MDPRLDPHEYQAVTVKSLRYHTTGDDHNIVHVDDDEYQVETLELLRTLVACQFADFQEPYTPPVVATGATAGTPGVWTPAGATPPASNQSLGGITATPTSVWTVGQYVVCADASEAHWNGAAWAVGRAS